MGSFRKKVYEAIIKILSPLVLIAGLWITNDAYEFSRSAQSATGVVVSIEQGAGMPPVYRPIVTYLGANGVEQIGHVSPYSSEIDFVVGAKIGILYLDDKPENVWVDDWISRWGAGLFLILLGGIPLLIWYGFRKKPAQ